MRIDPQRLERAAYPMFVEVQTRESDVDRQGHVNSLSLGFLFREGWGRLQTGLFADTDGGGGSVRRFLVVRITFDYTREVNYPDPVDVGAGVLAVGNSSLTLGLGLFQNDQCAALSDYTVVHADETGPQPLPEIVRERARAQLLVGGSVGGRSAD